MFNAEQDAFKALRDIVAERTTPIVAWVGAGLSAPAKLPTWPKLRTKLCEALQRKIATIPPQYVDEVQGALDTAQAENDYWTAFQILQTRLGQATYRNAIRRELEPAQTSAVPEAYRKIWRLRPSGILNLNLDRLATKAHAQIHPDEQLFEFIGLEADRHTHILKSPWPFVANLHGVAENTGSWVFTKKELNSLLNNKGYITFVRAALTTRVIVFAGMSADDIAAGKHIENLTDLGIDSGQHFWITDRNDLKTVTWAEKAGIQRIHYHNPDGSHSELLEILDALVEYVPQERQAAPVALPLGPTDCIPLPEPSELNRVADAEEIRRILNVHAARILKPNTPAAYEEYAQFCKKYNQAIYRAWYVSTEEPENKLLDFQLQSEIASGAFGTVFMATDASHETLAVKVLHQNIRNNQERLQSFRRGVHSMDILQRRKIKGMVPYRLAAEIPAVVVMDYVDGPSLDQAVTQKLISGWADVLKYSHALAEILEKSHKLPERVLHRDIRPSNVMIRNGWNERTEWELVVLDFDLSWHQDATELSISAPGTSNGYLAPEQVQRTRSTSTRNAAVDSFGIGMTLLFLKTGKEPVFSQHQHGDWSHKLDEYARAEKCNQWRSVPRRFFRLIEHATLHNQSERWDMTQIVGELSRLNDAFNKPEDVPSAELVAEEFAFRMFDERCQWSSDKLATRIDLKNGLEVTVSPREVDKQVELRVLYRHMGSGSRARQRHWSRSFIEKLESRLKNPAWRTAEKVVDAESFTFSALIELPKLTKALIATASGIGDVLTSANPY